MKTLEFVKTAKDGRIIIDVPESFEDKEVKVQVTECNAVDNPEHWSKLPGTEKLKILQQFAGTANYPDAETNKYDVYEQ